MPPYLIDQKWLVDNGLYWDKAIAASKMTQALYLPVIARMDFTQPFQMGVFVVCGVMKAIHFSSCCHLA